MAFVCFCLRTSISHDGSSKTSMLPWHCGELFCWFLSTGCSPTYGKREMEPLLIWHAIQRLRVAKYYSKRVLHLNRYDNAFETKARKICSSLRTACLSTAGPLRATMDNGDVNNAMSAGVRTQRNQLDAEYNSQSLWQTASICSCAECARTIRDQPVRTIQEYDKRLIINSLLPKQVVLDWWAYRIPRSSCGWETKHWKTTMMFGISGSKVDFTRNKSFSVWYSPRKSAYPCFGSMVAPFISTPVPLLTNMDETIS